MILLINSFSDIGSFVFLQLPLERLIEDRRQQGIQLGGSAALVPFDCLHFGLQTVQVAHGAALVLASGISMVVRLMIFPVLAWIARAIW